MGNSRPVGDSPIEYNGNISQPVGFGTRMELDLRLFGEPWARGRGAVGADQI